MLHCERVGLDRECCTVREWDWIGIVARVREWDWIGNVAL